MAGATRQCRGLSNACLLIPRDRLLTPGSGTAALIVMCALLNVPYLPGQTTKRTDHQVKAAYLYEFGKFVQWPARAGESKQDPFNICILGENPFGTALDSLSGQTINGQGVVIRQISKTQDSEECRVLFVAASEEKHVSIILAALQKLPILTVSDMPHFLNRGGMIQFLMHDSKLRFEVNRTATERVGLTLSSELLKVAVNVKTSQ
jgi:hypothetical protein